MQASDRDLLLAIGDGRASPAQLALAEARANTDAAFRDELENQQHVAAALAGIEPQAVPGEVIRAALVRWDQLSRERAVFDPKGRSAQAAPGANGGPGTSWLQSIGVLIKEWTMGDSSGFFSGTRGRVVIGGALAAVAVYGATIFLDTQADASKVSGTLAPAQRAQVSQIQAKNVQLGDEKVAHILQTDEYRTLLKSDAFKEVMKNEALLNVMKTDAFKEVMKNEALLNVMKTDSAAAVFKTDSASTVFKTEAFKEVMKNEALLTALKTDSGKGEFLKTDAFKEAMKTEAFKEAMKTDAFLNLMKTDAFMTLLKTDAALAVMKTDAFMSLMKTDAFMTLMKTDAFMTLLKTDAALAVMKTDSFKEVMKTDALKEVMKAETAKLTN